jgi:hypothetical protein
MELDVELDIQLAFDLHPICIRLAQRFDRPNLIPAGKRQPFSSADEREAGTFPDDARGFPGRVLENTQANCASNEFRMRSRDAGCKMPVNTVVLTRRTRFQRVDESRGI